MASQFQYSTTLRNAQLDQIETIVNASGAATLEIHAGTIPVNIAAADSGAPLAIITLGADWLSAAAAGQVSKTGAAWTDAAANANGTASYFRIKGGTTAHLQGTVGLSGATPDMVVDNTSFNVGQSFTVTSFSITAGNA